MVGTGKVVSPHEVDGIKTAGCACVAHEEEDRELCHVKEVGQHAVDSQRLDSRGLWSSFSRDVRGRFPEPS